MITLERKYAALLRRAEVTKITPVAEMRLCFEVLTLASMIDRDCAAHLDAYGLSEGKFVLLFLLDETEGGLSPHELAEQAGVTRGTITGLLDGLERSSLIHRIPHAVDRRKLIVQLTVEGCALARKLVDEHSKWIGSLFSGLSKDERHLLCDLLAKAFVQFDPDSRPAKEPGDDRE
jgi:DNA-binding MarR family transcriptional regulator